MAKLVFHDDIFRASFCGIITDEETMVALADPIKYLLTMGWSGPQYVNATPAKLNGLLRCKAMSMLSSNAGAPVLQALAMFVLRVTPDVSYFKMMKIIDKSHMSVWEKERMKLNLSTRGRAKPVLMSSRLVVEDVFNLPVAVQVRCEEYLDSLEALQPLEMPWVLDYCAEEELHYWVNYVSPDRNMTFMPARPTGPWLDMLLKHLPEDVVDVLY